LAQDFPNGSEFWFMAETLLALQILHKGLLSLEAIEKQL